MRTWILHFAIFTVTTKETDAIESFQDSMYICIILVESFSNSADIKPRLKSISKNLMAILDHDGMVKNISRYYISSASC